MERSGEEGEGARGMNNDETIAREMGRMEAEVNALKSDVAEIKSDVRVIRDAFNEAKGGWRTIALVAGVAGTVGALAAKIAPFLPFK